MTKIDMTDKLALRCLKHNRKVEDCYRCEYYYPSDTSSIVCRNLIGNNRCWDSIGIYSTKEFIEMISTNQVIDLVLKKYNIKIDRAVLRRYADLGLIEEGKKSGGGKGTGVHLDYAYNIIDIIYIIKLLLKEGFSLSEISEQHQMFIQGVMSHIAVYDLNNPDTENYYRVMVYFLSIEAKIDFIKHNLSKMNFKFEYIYSGPDHYYTDPPLYMKIIYIDGGDIVGEAIYQTR